MARKSKYTDEERIASNRYSSIVARAANIKWSREDFISWYVSEPKKCVYCNLSADEIKNFYELNKSKRKGTRGRSLEIDRINDLEYSKENCVLACYWCNNAKTDVFTFDEFMKIGNTMGDVIRKRIENA